MADGKNFHEDFMLEDEEEPYLSSIGENPQGMRNSATTDTLDSVLLESTPDDLPEKRPQAEGKDEAEEAQEPPSETSLPGPLPNKNEEFIQVAPDVKETSDIRSYFAADPGDNFFDSFGNGGGDEGKLGTDLFTSIAISKSEEDIRVSEMNAREIKDSDAISESNLSIDEFPNLSRNQSFQSMGDVTSQDEGNDPLSEAGKDESEKEDKEVIHIHHREHKTSASEPEPISFEGESDTLGGNVEASQDPKEFEEIIAQAEDIVQRPEYTSQTSTTSDSGTDPTGGPFGMANFPSSSLPDPNLHPTGPVVGSTPSQMSPMGTPIHHPPAAADASDLWSGKAAPTSPPVMDPPGFNSQTSVPSSPFHQIKGPEVGGDSPVFTSFNSSSPNDDAFSSILSMSDLERRHDAWIPSDATSHILFSMATNPPGTFTPNPEQLSSPAVIFNKKQGDPVRDLVLRYMGEQEAIKRSVLTVDSVNQDVDGLKKLIEAGCLRAAIDLTGILLEQMGQGGENASAVTVHTPHSLQLWFVRLTLMVKLRMYEQVEAEMRAFQTLDTPDLYFQFYANSYPGRRGSMVSFSMRLLHAEVPLLCGRSQESLDRLYYMMAVCNRIKSNLNSDLSEDGGATHMTYEARKVSLELWHQREVQILYKIAATMLSVKDYEGALAIYSSLMEKEKNAQLELKAGIGRIHLQMGNVNEASKIMKEVEAESSKGDGGSMPCFNYLNKGLVAMCSNNFHDAYQHFKSAVQIQPHNTCAVNNMAVCSLYLGRLKDALNTLEQLVHSDPANTLHEGVLFNLCTLYELETSRALHKKQAILVLVNQHKGDGFPVACLKMA